MIVVFLSDDERGTNMRVITDPEEIAALKPTGKYRLAFEGTPEQAQKVIEAALEMYPLSEETVARLKPLEEARGLSGTKPWSEIVAEALITNKRKIV